MEKIKINMLSSALKVKGQGVGSAFLEQVGLVSSDDLFDVAINSKKKGFDIYHHHTIDYYFKFRKKGIHVVYVHFLPNTLNGSIKLNCLFSKIFKSYVKRYYKKADEIVVVNPIYINELMELGIKRDKITYIPNYVSSENFYSKTIKEVDEIKEKYDIPKDKFVVLGVGQVQTRKGVKDFIEVAKIMPDMYFVWAGGFSFGAITDGYKELTQIVKNPPKNVKFLGIVDRLNMNDIYNLCDVLFVPSYNELFPMSILEAVCVNKPILLRNLELYEDILFDEYLRGDDNEDFCNKLFNLKNDFKIYKDAEEKSLRLSKFYSPKYVLNLWVKYYQEIVEKYKNVSL